MEYMLLIHSDDSAFATMSPQAQAQGMAAYGAYSEALNKAGVVRSANRLRPASMATNVKVRDGKTEVLNGPFIETREELGGYYLIDVPDLRHRAVLGRALPRRQPRDRGSAPRLGHGHALTGVAAESALASAAFQ